MSLDLEITPKLFILPMNFSSNIGEYFLKEFIDLYRIESPALPQNLSQLLEPCVTLEENTYAQSPARRI